MPMELYISLAGKKIFLSILIAKNIERKDFDFPHEPSAIHTQTIYQDWPDLLYWLAQRAICWKSNIFSLIMALKVDKNISFVEKYV